MEIFRTIYSTDQLVIMQRGIVQAERATVMMMFNEELQMTCTPPKGKLLILLSPAAYWKNTLNVTARLKS